MANANLMHFFRGVSAPPDKGAKPESPHRHGDLGEFGVSGGEQEFNYRKLVWVIVISVFLLFLVTDTIEHGFLPRLNIGRLDWYLTTAVATIMVWPASRIVLSRIEAMHRRLLDQNAILVRQAASLEQQSQRLSMAIQEAHHRIKNNLQIVAALLMLQDENSSVKDTVADSVRRIQAIALVHDFLSEESSLSEVNIAGVVQQLAVNLAGSLALGDRVVIEPDISEFALSSRRCTSLVLIVNELVLNALEHGFPAGRSGVIRISLKCEKSVVKLVVHDDGVGLSEGFVLSRDTQFGLNMVTSLAEGDLGGVFRLSSENGTTAEVTFPEYARESQHLYEQSKG